eukprot:366151-Chlamydomonas_euryale.AAC.2
MGRHSAHGWPVALPGHGLRVDASRSGNDLGLDSVRSVHALLALRLAGRGCEGVAGCPKMATSAIADTRVPFSRPLKWPGHGQHMRPRLAVAARSRAVTGGAATSASRRRQPPPAIGPAGAPPRCGNRRRRAREGDFAPSAMRLPAVAGMAGRPTIHVSA